MKKLLLVVCAVMLCSSPAWAGFVNGGFEDGNFNGWTRGSGYWTGGWPINGALYQPGGARYNLAYDASAVVAPGNDPIVGSNLNQVYAGNYAARVNNWNNNYSVSTIKQTVTNWQDDNIFFAWAAVLESSHGPTDSDNFTLTLRDDTAGVDIYNVAYNSATNGSIFNYYNGWYYTLWQVENLDTQAIKGHDLTLTLLGSDCPYGGHAGYVYLDGFGAVIPPAGPGVVPEPATMVLMASGLAGLFFRRKKV